MYVAIFLDPSLAAGGGYDYCKRYRKKTFKVQKNRLTGIRWILYKAFFVSARKRWQLRPQGSGGLIFEN